MRSSILLLLFLSTAALGQEQQTVGDGIPYMARTIASGISREHKPRVAVLPFEELYGPRTAFGVYVAEALTTQLVREGTEVVERAMVERVMKKLGITSAAGIDAETARILGEETRVEAIIFGTIADMDSAIAVNGRVRDAASGRIITASEVMLARDGSVEGMLAQLLESGGAAGTPPAGGGGGGPEPRNLTWSDGAVRVSIENPDRVRSTIDLTLLFTNTGAKPLQLMARKYTLVDEHGDEYHYGYDGKSFATKGVSLAPGKQNRSAFFFVCRAGDCDGETFTMKDDAGTVLVKNLKIE